MQERLFDSVFNCFSLFNNSLIEIVSILSDLVKDKDGIFYINFSFLLQFLNSCDDFSGESSNFKLFILFNVEQYYNLFSTDSLMFFYIISNKFVQDKKITKL